MKRLMVCSAGTGGGFATITAARRHWSAKELFLIATDTNPPHLCAASLFADEYMKVLPATDSDYPRQIGEIIRRHKPDGIVAAVDEEIFLIGRTLEALGIQEEIRLAIPDRNVWEVFEDKLSLFRFLERNGFPVPSTKRACDAGTMEFFFKPITGAGSKGVFIGQADSLPRSNALSQWIAQEICHPPEITVDVIIDGAITHTLCRERIEVKSGVSVKARIFRDEGLSVLADRLARSLGFTYGFCFQVMAGKDGEFRITDLNPRLGAGSAMSYLAGSDFFGANVSKILDAAAPLDSFFKEFEGQAFVVRQYSEFLTGRSSENAIAHSLGNDAFNASGS